jgi:hypothetical protein
LNLNFLCAAKKIHAIRKLAENCWPAGGEKLLPRTGEMLYTGVVVDSFRSLSPANSAGRGSAAMPGLPTIPRKIAARWYKSSFRDESKWFNHHA